METLGTVDRGLGLHGAILDPANPSQLILLVMPWPGPVHQLTTSRNPFDTNRIAEESKTSNFQGDMEPQSPTDGPALHSGVEDIGDDDFGAFSDASFADFEEPRELEEEVPAGQVPTVPSSLPQTLFQDRDALGTRLTELTLSLFPEQPAPFAIPDDTLILNSRSQHLLDRLIAPPHLKPYNWQHGSLRRQLLITLGLPDDTMEKKVRKNEFDMDKYVVIKLDDLRISNDVRKEMIDGTDSLLDGISLVSEDELFSMEQPQLEQKIQQMELQLSQVERHLSVWEDEKHRLEDDHKTFESVVENLVGHTQRMRREETMRTLKKEKERSKLKLFKRKTFS